MTIAVTGTVVRDEFVLDVDIDFPAGLTMLRGPNGAGKTTLLRLIAGLDGLDTGTLRIDETVMDEPAARVFVPAHRRRIAMAFQDHRLFGHLSVIDNVAFPLRRRGMPRDDARDAARRQVDAMGLSTQAKVRPAALSIGQQQRCALARALATPADVLLLDEPLASIDEPSRAEIRERLRDVDGATVLWVTHDSHDIGPENRTISVESGILRQTRRR